MRVNILEIENILKQYFYINKFEYEMYEEMHQLLKLNNIAIYFNNLKTIDLVELIEILDYLYSKYSEINKNKWANLYNKSNINYKVFLDFKDYLYNVYRIDENKHKYLYASIPELKNMRIYKKEHIINNPNIKDISKEMDYDIGCIKVTITTIENEIINKYVFDWKETNQNNDRKLLYVFGQAGAGSDDFNKRHIIRADEYSK